MSLPKTMKALKCVDAGKAEVVEVPLPKLRDDYLLVKTTAVALNPTDWKHIDKMAIENATVGCDLAGTVVEVGSAVTKTWKKGDRVAAMTHGVNKVEPEDGAFAEYAVVKGDIAMRIPDGMKDIEAASIGVGIATTGQSFQRLGIPYDSHSEDAGKFILIYGGSTATGLWALQFAKAAGLKPIATCSKRNFEVVKSYGAVEAFDYSDPKCAASIRDYTKNTLSYVLDCISEGSAIQICADSIREGPSSDGGPAGKYCSLLPVKFPRDDVECVYTLAYSVTGERFEFRGGRVFEASKEDFEYAKKTFNLAEQLFANDELKAIPLDVREGPGLAGVLDGLDDIRQGRVSGRKIVYVV